MNLKNNIFKYIVVVLGIVIITLLLVLCFKDDDDDNKELIELNAPVVTLTDDTASWDYNDKAKKFEISINGVLSYLDNTITSYQLELEESLKVRAIGDGINYSDSDWSSTITYTIAPKDVYTVNFYDYSGTNILETVLVEDGDAAVYSGDNPTRDDEYYSYSFIGWYTKAIDGEEADLSNITSNLDVYARFSQIQNRFTVNFYDYSGTNILDTILVDAGETVVYSGDVPIRDDEYYSYSFIGWYTEKVDGEEADLSNITSNLDVYARFSQSQKEYIVKFYDYNGELLKEENVLAGETATAPDVIERDGFVFIGWYDAITEGNVADLTEILSNKEVYVRLSALSTEIFVVKFYGHNGEILKEESVQAGEAATAPDVPEVEGYEFTGWDKSYLFIAEDIEINAEYAQLFYVTFIDYNNSVIKSQYVIDGGSAVAPDYPIREGYEFIGWDKLYNNVTNDLVIKAQYDKLLIVTFKDYDGTILDTQYVRKDGSAIAPVVPEKEYYEFTGWDKSIDNITEDIVITAQYEIVEHSVTFVMPDGSIIGEIQYVEHNDFAQEPEYPEYFVSGGNNPNGAYKFTGWDKIFDQIIEDTIVNAIYDTVIEDLVIIVDFSEENNSKANLYLLNSVYATLNAIEFSIEYKTTEGNVVINSVTVNDASPLWVEGNDGTNDNQYVINNNTKEFTFAWSNAAGKQFDWCSKLLTFNFSTDGTDVSQFTFKVLEDCNAIVSDSSGGNMTRITPLIIYS